MFDNKIKLFRVFKELITKYYFYKIIIKKLKLIKIFIKINCI